MATQGPNLPSTGADDASIGTITWSGPGNITADDGVIAAAAFGASEVSHYLKGTGFGFTISGTPNGITFVCERQKTGNPVGNVTDNAVRIVKGGVIGATDRSDAGNWPTSLTDKTYGGITDLWGETWADTDINASNFGVALSAKDTGSGSTGAEVDKFTISVDYTPGDVTYPPDGPGAAFLLAFVDVMSMLIAPVLWCAGLTRADGHRWLRRHQWLQPWLRPQCRETRTILFGRDVAGLA